MVSCFLQWGKGGGGSVGPGRGVPLGGAVCRDHEQYPALVPGSSEVAIGFWSFCILLFMICSNCAHGACSYF